MKKLIVFSMAVILSVFVVAQDYSNDFYDDTQTWSLFGPTTIEVSGEIENPGTVNLCDFQKHSVIVKEAKLLDKGNHFIGAYRYDGISLYDILDRFVLDKKNNDHFGPIIDLYVEVENSEGEKVILSWGEIYYPVNRHQIIIATDVARIVPSKTKELWPLPEKTKLVVGPDLITERNISNPMKIRILSSEMKFRVQKGMSPMYAPEITIFDQSKKIQKIEKLPKKLNRFTYETIFYGRGRGIHSTTPFQGVLLNEILADNFALSPESIKKGYFVISSEDGYRAVFTFSEVMNRNDRSELLLVDEGNVDGGMFRLFPSFDFFSDRAIKSTKEIYFLTIP